jgi:hypothetical protein
MVVLALCATAILSCSSGTANPVNPIITPGKVSATTPSDAQANLWGYYDVYIDTQTQTVTATVNRQAMFTANVVNFINGKPAGLSFKINSTPIGSDYIDVDIDVSITHPFPGLSQYNGYDVRGVFMGDGSAQLATSGVTYAVKGTDQSMFPDPVDSIGGPDGYTRWFNLTEFSQGGMPLFQYTKGKLASPSFAGTATLNPYKYFADGLGAAENLTDWLSIDSNVNQHGIFSSGVKNTRNYYLRFPNAKGVKFGYAITATWSGAEPQYHPSNTPEAIACTVGDQSNVFYVDSTQKGGNINIFLNLFDWLGQPSAIYIESTVLSAPHQLDASEMMPISGNETWSAYHVDIPADNISGATGNEYWILAEYTSNNYSNKFGVPNLAENDPLIAYFRYDLSVSTNPTGQAPTCDLVAVTPLPAKGWDVGTPVTFDASGSSDPDIEPITFAWDFNGDGLFDQDPDDSYTGPSDKPTHSYTADYNGQVCVKVSDNGGLFSTCCIDVAVDTVPSKNFPLRDDSVANDIAINPNTGDLLVLYEDGQIWQYLLTDYFQMGSKFHDLKTDWGIYQDLSGLDFMDIASNNMVIVTGIASNGQGREAFYIADGTPSQCSIYPGSLFMIFDAYAFGGTGTFADDGGDAFAYDQDGTHYTQIERYEDPDYCSTHFMTYQLPGPPLTGYDRLYGPYCAAVETDKYGDMLWFLENTDFYASRWLATGTGTYGNLTYNNAYFGTGSQTDNDNGWYNGLDICRDDQNRYFVLDQLSSGDPRIKMWTVNGNNTTSKGGFSDSTSINSTPLRIEGGDTSSEVVVLHGDAAPNKISVFLPVEMPS